MEETMNGGCSCCGWTWLGSAGATAILGTLQNGVLCGIDIGGTLAKLVYVDDPNYKDANDLGIIAECTNIMEEEVDQELMEKTYDRLTRSDKEEENDKFWKPQFIQDVPCNQQTEHFGNCSPSFTICTNRCRFFPCRNREKMVERWPYFCTYPPPLAFDNKVIRFDYFYTKNIGQLIAFISEKRLTKKYKDLKLTGGGAYKYSEEISKKLGVNIRKYDEMRTIMRGLTFLISYTKTAFRYDIQLKRRILVDIIPPLYPFLVVNIGSGVSIIKANGPDDFVRVTGTCVGGGTVLGLARLIFGAKSFDEVVELSKHGTDCLDLKVSDLYGDAAGSSCLPGDTLASSFGKVFFMNSGTTGKNLRKSLRKEDIARSLLHMVSYNLGYLAYLVGVVHNVKRIFFAGKHINNHSFTMESITEGLNFYMKQYCCNTTMCNCQEYDLDNKLNNHVPINATFISSSQNSNSANSSFVKCTNIDHINTIDYYKKNIDLRNDNQNNSKYNCNEIIDDCSNRENNCNFTSCLNCHNGSNCFYTEASPTCHVVDQNFKNCQFDNRILTISDYASSKMESQISSCLNLPKESSPFEVLFLRHDGYLGALGSFISSD